MADKSEVNKWWKCQAELAGVTGVSRMVAFAADITLLSNFARVLFKPEVAANTDFLLGSLLAGVLGIGLERLAKWTEPQASEAWLNYLDALNAYDSALHTV